MKQLLLFKYVPFTTPANVFRNIPQNSQTMKYIILFQNILFQNCMKTNHNTVCGINAWMSSPGRVVCCLVLKVAQYLHCGCLRC